VDAIVKQCRPKVTGVNDFLSGGHPGEVAPASATMAVVQDSIDFVNSQASMEYSVDPSPI
jgi:hypothetical protein